MTQQIGNAQCSSCKSLLWRQRPEAECRYKPRQEGRLGFAVRLCIFFGVLLLGTGAWGASGDERWRHQSDLSGLKDDIDAMAQDQKQVYTAGEPQSEDGDEDFVVRALDKQTGDEVWHQQFGRMVKNDDSDALAVRGSRVFLVGAIEESEELGVEERDIIVVAFDTKTGDIQWRRELGQPGRDDAANSIVARGSRVFVAGMITTTNGDEDLFVVALDTATGDVQWEYQFDLNGDDDEPAAIAVNAGRVFVAGRGRTAAGERDILVWALDAKTGTQLWVEQFDLVGSNDIASALTVRGPQVFVAGESQVEPENPEDPEFEPATDAVVLALDKETGTILWHQRFDLEQDDVGNDTIRDIDADGSHLYVVGEGVTARGDEDAVVLALDKATGDIRWQHQFDLEQDGIGDDSGRAIKQEQNRVIVAWRGETSQGDRDAIVMGLRRSTGEFRWQNQFDLNKGDDSPDVMVVDSERVYVGGESQVEPEDPEDPEFEPNADMVVRALEF